MRQACGFSAITVRYCPHTPDVLMPFIGYMAKRGQCVGEVSEHIVQTPVLLARHAAPLTGHTR